MVDTKRAIETAYLGPIEYPRGIRIMASDCDGNSVTIGSTFPHDNMSGEDVHRKAAEALKRKMGWCGELVAGAVKKGYVFVFVS